MTQPPKDDLRELVGADSRTTLMILILAALLFGGLRTSLMFTVHTQEAIIVERFGKFRRVAHAGLGLTVRTQAFAGSSRSSRRRILPTLVLGSSSRNSMIFGRL